MNDQFVNTRGQSIPVAKSFMTGVFGWMFIALAISAVTAWLVATTPSFLQLLYHTSAQGGGMTILGWIVMLAPLGFVFAISSGMKRFSASTMAILFVVFSVLMGASLSWVLLLYTSASIVKTFLITSGMFGVMAFVGYTTKTDLTKFGSIMFMGLIGIIIASLVNFFLHSSGLDYIISFLGVLIFTGLTAYDMQMLKRVGMQAVEGDETTRKMIIFGALSLYLDFINLFLLLLRFFGDRR
ncbi:MAG: Bax inhibitor-1/YccA family protein [Bacteroidales bacterium]|nr:Bax inhibitor-1/YccA family protein [Bacteroidales bacterium]